MSLEAMIGRLLEIEEKRVVAEFGRYVDAYKYNVTLKPGENKLLFEAKGSGTLIETIASIIMPDDTKPEVQFELQFDENYMLDWTCEEYYSLIGFMPVPGYGGCTIYDTTNKVYAWWSNWEGTGGFNSLLRVFLHNLTNVTVTVNIWDVELRLIGEYKIY